MPQRRAVLRLCNDTHAPLGRLGNAGFPMGKYTHSLKTLRDIALEYGRVELPDLASMARERHE